MDFTTETPWEELYQQVKYDHLNLLKEVSRLKRHLRYSNIMNSILGFAFAWAALSLYLS